MENNQEVPLDIKLVMAVNPVKRQYEAWRVVAYRSDGTWFYVSNRSGLDYKLERNAAKEAERYNNVYAGVAFAVVKKIKITESEV